MGMNEVAGTNAKLFLKSLTVPTDPVKEPVIGPSIVSNWKFANANVGILEVKLAGLLSVKFVDPDPLTLFEPFVVDPVTPRFSTNLTLNLSVAPLWEIVIREEHLNHPSPISVISVSPTEDLTNIEEDFEFVSESVNPPGLIIKLDVSPVRGFKIAFWFPAKFINLSLP